MQNNQLFLSLCVVLLGAGEGGLLHVGAQGPIVSSSLHVKR